MSLWVHRYSIFTFYDNFKRKIQKREEHTIDLVLSGRVAIGGGKSSSSSSGVDGPVEFSCLDGCCCKRIIKYLNIFADQYWYKVFFNFPSITAYVNLWIADIYLPVPSKGGSMSFL